MKPVVFLFTALLLLGVLVAQPSEMVVQERGYADWERMSLRERRLYVEAFAAGQMALLVDLHPAGQELVMQAYNLTILSTSVDHIVVHLEEIYEQPGFRQLPLAVATQLAHHYVWQIRQGYTRPLPIHEEARIRRR